DDLFQSITPERLEPVGVGAGKAQQCPEERGIDDACGVPQNRSLVTSPSDELGADDHVRLSPLQKFDGAGMKLGVTEIDLVPEHVPPARFEDTLSQCVSVIGLAQ